ncbi:hypothetical protein D9611_004886 [Ephemerocybe angulata]|uniref:DUF726-domain-containing protein n=1 Tax=Ephemerocybe angulata TaxID=980116 RepID=A0A8H5B459_9AGAR|nr:hypothetical protein D9611_004886 [Tulosesus angulatus]
MSAQSAIGASVTPPRSPPFPRTTSLDKITPPKHLSKPEKLVVFEYFFRQLTTFRNTALIYAEAETQYETVEAAKDPLGNTKPDVRWRIEYGASLNVWSQALLRNAWVACTEEDESKCPVLDPYADTSIQHLIDSLPSTKDISQLVNTILFLNITQSKQYSALTRAFLTWLGDQLGGRDVRHHITDTEQTHKERSSTPLFELDEEAIAWTLKNPETAIEQAQKQAQAVTTQHAERSKVMRGVGVSLSAIAGGVLIGVTGGLAAPLVGAGVAGVLGFFGVGGTILGLLASGIAGSGVICGALFGVYGAKSTAAMVERHTREVRDLAVVPVRKGGSRRSSTENLIEVDLQEKKGEDVVRDTLAVRLCVSGWLNDKKDVTAPWTVFGGDDTFALQWEIEALEELANAIKALLQAEAIKYVKGEVIKRTMLAGLMSALAPLGLLRIGQIIDNPYMNARALGIKTGAVLADLLMERALGNRPVTLVGYSLGSLVIYEALLELAARAPSQTLHLIQDVYLFGSPVPADPDNWAKIRRVVTGRVVNGYSDRDYVLAVLSRAADATWNVAGLEPVAVKGVENMNCSEVTGHTAWRGLVGKYLRQCGAPGILAREVDQKEAEVTEEEVMPVGQS